jgi:hypothetical protein
MNAKPSGVRLVAVGVVGNRLVGAAEADQVGHDGTTDFRQYWDHVPVEIAPRRLSVEHEDGVALAVLDVGHAQTLDLHVARLVGEAGQVGEAFVGRSQHRALGPGRLNAGELRHLRRPGRGFGHLAAQRRGQEVGVDLVLWGRGS